MKSIIFSILLGCSLLLKAEVSSPALEQSRNLYQWLEKNESFFTECITKKQGDKIILCDNTQIAIEEIKTMFRMSAAQLVNYIKKQGVKLEIICMKESGEFTPWCVRKSKQSNFKKRYYLQGQFLGRENTILLRANAYKGSLIHEYIHFLEFKNSNKVLGHRYKYERVEIERKLIQRMDEIIAQVKKDEAALRKSGKLPALLKEMVALSSSLQKFSKFQDLIDERNIFDLYLRWGKLLGIPDQDRKLAAKNLEFICKRKDLSLGAKQCFTTQFTKREKGIWEQVKRVIEEVRPRPSFALVKRFLKNVPDRGRSLKENITLINSYIFKTWSIVPDHSYRSIEKMDNILPDSTLKFKRAHCVGLATLYLLAFEQIGIKAQLLRIPGHVLVQVCDKKQCYWIETLERGKIISKQYYIKQGVVTAKELEDTYYLTPSSLVSSIYLSLGFIAAKSKQYDVAELFYKRSIDADRRIVDAYANLAALYFEMGKKRLSRTYLNIALKVNPHSLNALTNKAIELWQEGKQQAAFEIIKQAKTINPLKDFVLKTSFNFNRQKKRWKQAFLDGLIYNLQHKSDCHFFSKLQSIRRYLTDKVRSAYRQDWKQLSAACPK
jgi:tetratricopeptide (TPR) repeat protein